MYRINMDYLKRWRKNSIAIARELGLLEGDILEMLENNTQLVLENKSKRRKSARKKWYGYVSKDKLTILVYEENLARFLPIHLREICNQTGMDHLLIRHLGCHLSGTEYKENVAYEVHIALADKRGETSKGWKNTSKLLQYYYKINPVFRSKIFYF